MKNRVIMTAAILSCFALLGANVSSAADTETTSTEESTAGMRPIKFRSEAPVASAPARSLPTYRAPVTTGPAVEAPEREVPEQRSSIEAASDPALQRNGVAGGMPPPSLNFPGISATGVLPPDTSGDVGLLHFVQMVNSTQGAMFQVFDKSSGSAVTGLLRMGDLFLNTQDCHSTQKALGDGTVLYDQLENRWIMAQFTNGPSPYRICISVSATPNPTLGWYSYEFTTQNDRFPDYLKFGVWGDGLYMTANEYGDAPANDGIAVRAFDKAAMYAAQGTNGWYWHLDAADGYHTLVPADIEGPNAPPAGENEWFMAYDLNQPDTLLRWQAEVNSFTDAGQTFFSPDPVAIKVPAFTPDLCANVAKCIPQPGTTQLLDSITDGLMWRMAYRNLGDRQVLAVTHAINVNDERTGIRWYEWDLVTGEEPGVPTQVGTWSPDSTNRWIPTPALDKHGNLAIGYSVSDGASTYPGIRYAGRLASDYPATLRGEEVLVPGAGSQTHATGRWGDYAQMSVDPTDDCTFWFTSEYMASTSAAAWSTRIGTFKFPSCDLKSTTANGKLSKPYKRRSGVYLYHRGVKATFQGTITPRQAGSDAMAWIQRKTGSSWTAKKTFSRNLDTKSRFKVVLKTRGLGKGYYRIAANFPGDGNAAGSTSAWYRFKITK